MRSVPRPRIVDGLHLRPVAAGGDSVGRRGGFGQVASQVAVPGLRPLESQPGGQVRADLERALA